MGKPTLYSERMIAEYRRKGYWQDTTFADVWDRNALEYPNKEAVIDEKIRITWSEAKLWTDRVALGLLDLGLKKDEMIVIQLPNCVELILFRIACEKAGVLCLPVPWALRHKEIEYILNKVEASGIVIPQEFNRFHYFEMINEIRPRLPALKHIFVTGDHVPEGCISVRKFAEKSHENKHHTDYLKNSRFGALEFSWVQLTGGTTGFPKFVEAPICGRVYSGKVFADACGMNNEDVCGMFAVGPVGPNIFSSICAPLVGAKIVMLPKFEAGEALRLIERERISVVGLVPTMLAMMIRHQDFDRHDLTSLRVVIVTGASFPSSLAIEADTKINSIVQFLGSVDFGAVTVPYIDAPRETRLFTVNKPLPGNEIRFVDDRNADVPPGEVGEIVVRGPGCNAGLYKDAEATWQVWTKDGWFKSGDLGKFDEGGNLVVIGRKKDVIIRGGQNIFPGEVENILLQHPNVESAAVVGMPDPIMGERACAFVVPKSETEFKFDEMLDFLKEKSIASYKLPERLEIVAQLPLVPGSNKVDKKILSSAITEKLKAEGKI